MKRKIVVGSRDSKLAIMQTKIIMQAIKAHHPELELELVTLKTTGDLILDKTLDKIGGKGLFVKELDQALLDGRIDIAVHSLKDMPMEENKDLPIVATYIRGDARDALVLPKEETEKIENCSLTKLNQKYFNRIGSSSARRTLQLKELLPYAITGSVRGNIVTRLEKLDCNEYSSLILAAAGLQRAEYGDRISRYFSVEEMIPAAGQGILAVQARKDEDVAFLQAVHDETTYCEAMAERSFVRTLDGGCSSPIAAHAMTNGENITLTGLYYNEVTKEHKRGTITGLKKDAISLGMALANRLKLEIG